MVRRTTERRSERQRRGEPVVRKVFEVTLEQLARHGYEHLSVPAIAELAGLNKTSVYRRWPTKGDLVREALTASMGHSGSVPDTGSLRSDMLAMARAALGFAQSPLGIGVLGMLFADARNQEVRAFVDSMFRQQETEQHRRVFERAVARGELAADADVRLILSTIAGCLMHRVFVEQERVTDALLESLIDLVLFGASSVRQVPAVESP